MRLFEIIKLDSVNNYFIFDVDELKSLKDSLAQEKISLIEKMVSDYFDAKTESVTTKVQNEIVLNSKHDYASLATYWWKNPDTKNGLPYIRKDGMANPYGKEFDKDKFKKVATITYFSALLYFLTDKDEYYKLMEKHLYNWFINPKTRMNPNMNHGQFVPGINEGRAEGIIDYTANFAYALHMLKHLYDFGLLKDDIYLPIKQWHIDFKSWLLNSEIGKNEGLAKNNHGIMYYLGLIIISEFIESTKDVDLFINKSNSLMEQQIDKEYKLTFELKRTKSRNYTLMCYKGLYDIDKLSINYNTKLNQEIFKKIAEWLIPFYCDSQPWEYEQITQYDTALNIYFTYSINKKFRKKLSCKIDTSKMVNRTIFYLFSPFVNVLNNS